MPRKFVLSPTKLRMYYRCHAEYRLEYIDKLGRFYHRARAGFSFGHSLHRTLEAFHTAGGTEAISETALTESLTTMWVEKGYEGEEQENAFREEGVRILKEYHAAQVTARETAPPDAPPPPHILFTEKTLRMDLSADVALSGRVDRIDEHHDGSLEIVDYKSGRTEVDVEDVAGSVALNIYQLLLKHLMPERRIFATLVALRSGASASYELTEEDRELLLTECREIGEEILRKEWDSVKPIPNDHCPYCDYHPYCKKYWKRYGLPDGLPMVDDDYPVV